MIDGGTGLGPAQGDPRGLWRDGACPTLPGRRIIAANEDAVNNAYEGAEEGDNQYPTNVMVTIP